MIVVKPTKAGIAQAVKILKRDGVIVYPTDTAYALGGLFSSRKVTAKILKIKKRRDKKFTLIAANQKQVENFFPFSVAQKKLAKKYWPGPLSIIVSPRFAVRVPKNLIARELAKLAKAPLIATSANISGQETLYSSQDIINQFENNKVQPDLIINNGCLKKIKTSTVVKVSGNQIKIVRPGAVKL